MSAKVSVSQAIVATFFLFFNPICSIFRVFIKLGVLAQLVERLNGIEKVRGSNPLGSTPILGDALQILARIGPLRLYLVEKDVFWW